MTRQQRIETSIEYLICDVGTLSQAREDHRWLDSLLSPAEAAHSNRLRQAADRAAYRSGHLLFRLMAARRLGIEPRDAGELTFTRTCRTCGGPHGKPQIMGAELSLSRSGDMVAVASAPSSSPIGIDIEHIPNEVFSGFDEYVLTSGESLSPGANTTRRRIELWVAKEAALKTTGDGLNVEPSGLEVVGTDREAAVVPGSVHWAASIRAPEHPELNRLSLATVPCPPSHAAALSCADRLPVTSTSLSDVLIG
ncbi:4'-phosphopantetheinyl transferase family protein [Brevibacterium sp. FME17]|uniref:4'-phosphopantetheinyl transferase family protein n=1 Tax=Brevibacterium sp. FME17 TaxID=2742606 RepID=UPI0018667AE9|nr:4'-phosphopantetheinyl transferase superfamily protein [Brevibacterium sp. FME17]